MIVYYCIDDDDDDDDGYTTGTQNQADFFSLSAFFYLDFFSVLF